MRIVHSVVWMTWRFSGCVRGVYSRGVGTKTWGSKKDVPPKSHERARRRAQRIQKTIPILRVLSDLGYQVREDGGDREQQFPCDIHGDGRDGIFSARVYPDSASWYCWACGSTRDAIQTIREKMDLSFWGAVYYLERKYNLPPMPEDPDDPGWVEPPSIEAEIGTTLREGSFEQDAGRLRQSLDNLTHDRDLPMEVTAAFWEAFDKVVWFTTSTKVPDPQRWPENKGRRALARLQSRLGARVQEEMCKGSSDS